MIDQADTWQHAAARAAQQRDWSALRHIASEWTTAQPASVEAWRALSRSYFEQSQFAQSVAAFEHVLQLEPDQLIHQVSAARLATAAQQYSSARALLEDAAKKASLIKTENAAAILAEILYPLARVYQLTGELVLAEECCRRSIDARPGYPPAYTLLGTLREGQLADTDINAIKTLLNHPGLHPEYRAMLGFTLGDALDKRGEYAAAFSVWEAANQINQKIYQQEGIVYRRDQQEAEFGLLDRIFSEAFDVPDPQDLKTTPIFVVGMPRSGTTLVESILASHSQVDGAGELPGLCEIHDNLLDIAHQQGIKAARDTLARNAVIWREKYLSALPGNGDSRFVVDKQPLNFRSVGLIRVLFPNSPIIYTQRSAVDIGFSIYRHNFTKNWPCAHRLDDIAHYLTQHASIMTLWRERYAENIHVLDHALLVQNPQQEIHRLLDFAGLSHEPACLLPHQTKRSIATFSAVQVRKPVSAAYSGRSVHYLPWLGALDGVS